MTVLKLRVIEQAAHKVYVLSLMQANGQVDLAETDENGNGNENERGNENEKGNGRQEDSNCGIGRRPCKPTLLCKIVWSIQRLVTGSLKASRQAAHASYINYVAISWANIH